MLSTHLLSASLAINSLAIPSLAIKLICYQLSCYHIHLLSSLICYPASTAIDTLAIRPICYQSSVAINNFAINHHLLSNFRLALNHYLKQFFLKIRKKMEKFLKIWNSSVSGKLCVGIESARFVASSKVTNSRLKENG